MEVSDIIAKDIFNFKRQGLLWNLSQLAINRLTVKCTIWI